MQGNINLAFTLSSVLYISTLMPNMGPLNYIISWDLYGHTDRQIHRNGSIDSTRFP